jgi:signal transduction histidine kinase
VPGTASGIDSLELVREKVLRIGRHHLYAGLGLSHVALASLEKPATNWRDAALATDTALGFCRDPVHNYQAYRGGKLDHEYWAEDLAYAYLNRGSALTALGSVVDSVAVIEGGLALLRSAAAVGGFRTTDRQALLAMAFGTGFLRRLETQLAAGSEGTAAADLDSVWHYLDQARDLCDVSNTRAYWRLHRTRASAAELQATLRADALGQSQALATATAELRESMRPLRDTTDDLELALSQADLAAIEAKFSILGQAREGFTLADSLLDLAASALTRARFPIQHAELALRQAQVYRLRWRTFGAANDSLAAKQALADLRASVLRVEYPSLHRRADEEAAALAPQTRPLPALRH